MKTIPSLKSLVAGGVTCLLLVAIYKLTPTSVAPLLQSTTEARETVSFESVDRSMPGLLANEPQVASEGLQAEAELDLNTALQAFEQAVTESGDILSEGDLANVDRLMTNLRLQAEYESRQE